MATSGFGGFVKGFAQGLDRQLQKKQDLKMQQDQDVFRAKLGDYFSQRDAERKKFGQQQGIVNALKAAGLDDSVIGEAVRAIVAGGMPIDDAITTFGDLQMEGGQQNLPYTPVSEEPDLTGVIGEQREGLFDSIPKFFGGQPAISEKVKKITSASGGDPKQYNSHVTGATNNTDQPYRNPKFTVKTKSDEEYIKRAIAASTTEEKAQQQVAMLVSQGRFDLADKVTSALNYKDDTQLPKQYQATEKKKGWITTADGEEARVLYNEFGFQVLRKKDGKTVPSEFTPMGLMPSASVIINDEKGNLSFAERQQVAEQITPMYEAASKTAETVVLTTELREAATGFAAQSQSTLVGGTVRLGARVNREIKLFGIVADELQKSGILDPGANYTPEQIMSMQQQTLSKLGALFQTATDLTDEDRLLGMKSAQLAYHLLGVQGQKGQAVSTKEFALFQSALMSGSTEQLVRAANAIEKSTMTSYRNQQLDQAEIMRQSETEQYNSIDLSQDPLKLVLNRLPSKYRRTVREQYLSNPDDTPEPEASSGNFPVPEGQPSTIQSRNGEMYVWDETTGEYTLAPTSGHR